MTAMPGHGPRPTAGRWRAWLLTRLFPGLGPARYGHLVRFLQVTSQAWRPGAADSSDSVCTGTTVSMLLALALCVTCLDRIRSLNKIPPPAARADGMTPWKDFVALTINCPKHLNTARPSQSDHRSSRFSLFIIHFPSVDCLLYLDCQQLFQLTVPRFNCG